MDVAQNGLPLEPLTEIGNGHRLADLELHARIFEASESLERKTQNGDNQSLRGHCGEMVFIARSARLSSIVRMHA